MVNVHPSGGGVYIDQCIPSGRKSQFYYCPDGCTLTNVHPPGGGVYIGQCTPIGRMGDIDQYPSGLAIYFSSYYNVNGITMARRYWRIPSSSFEVQAIPPPPSASPPEIRGIASTSQDSEGIRQYLLAMVMPLSQSDHIL